MWAYRAELVRVIDGDTVEVKIDLGFHVFTVQKLRLMGINAPEVRGASRPAGLEASHHLSVLIDQLAPISVMTKRDKQGKYGRYLAVLQGSDGCSINERMIQDGHAVTY